MNDVLLFIYLCTWHHLAESKDPWPVTVGEDTLSDHPKERTRRDVRREDVEGYLAHRGIAHRWNAKQRSATDAPLGGACISHQENPPTIIRDNLSNSVIISDNFAVPPEIILLIAIITTLSAHYLWLSQEGFPDESGPLVWACVWADIPKVKYHAL